MALLFLDSFDDRTTNMGVKYDHSTGTLASTGARTGNGISISATTNAQAYVLRRFDRYSGWIAGMAVKSVAPTNVTNDFFELQDNAGNKHLFLRVNSSTNKVEVCRGSDSWVIGKSTTTMVTSGFNYVELTAVIDAVTGSVILTVNGQVELTSGSLNTRNGANPYATVALLGSTITQTGLTRTLIFDDYYLANTLPGLVSGAVGPVSLACLFPNASGSYSQWSCDASVNYVAVADTNPNSGVTTIYATVPGVIDLYNLQNLATTGIVKGTQLIWNGVNDDLYDRIVQPYLKSAGSEAAGLSYALSGVTYRTFSHVFESNPVSASGWHTQQIADGEFGLKLIR